MCRFFRQYLTSQGFVEIHTPKIIGGNFIQSLHWFKKDLVTERQMILYFLCEENHGEWPVSIRFKMVSRTICPCGSIFQLPFWPLTPSGQNASKVTTHVTVPDNFIRIENLKC